MFLKGIIVSFHKGHLRCKLNDKQNVYSKLIEKKSFVFCCRGNLRQYITQKHTHTQLVPCERFSWFRIHRPQLLFFFCLLACNIHLLYVDNVHILIKHKIFIKLIFWINLNCSFNEIPSKKENRRIVRKIRGSWPYVRGNCIQGNDNQLTYSHQNHLHSVRRNVWMFIKSSLECSLHRA